MASDAEGDEFLGFKTEEEERARALRSQLSGESDVSVSESESKSTSERESKGDINTGRKITRLSMLKNLSNARVQLHKFQKMEQLWISFSFSDQKICSKKLWRKPTVMPNCAFKQNQT